ncbi:MAG: ankyrin repeat domain-containing protein [Rhodospirillaceae bacterium]|nr:ankyrin repeat domain-containing protein [Rhodospirillaceae bacterium]
MPAATNSPLIDAVNNGDPTALARALSDTISRSADLEARDGDARTALMLATRANDIEAARLLIEAGADVNAKDSIKDTPFLYSGAEGLDDILVMTLGTGADLADTNRYGGTALIPACHHAHPSTVRILLATTIDIDHINDLGWTALMETVILGDGGPVFLEILNLLLDAGADADIPDHDGIAPLAHARALGFNSLAQTLETAAAKR